MTICDRCGIKKPKVSTANVVVWYGDPGEDEDHDCKFNRELCEVCLAALEEFMGYEVDEYGDPGG